jgi:DNA-directed RNA polymerase subunit RPC12/RpoP
MSKKNKEKDEYIYDIIHREIKCKLIGKDDFTEEELTGWVREELGKWDEEIGHKNMVVLRKWLYLFPNGYRCPECGEDLRSAILDEGVEEWGKHNECPKCFCEIKVKEKNSIVYLRIVGREGLSTNDSLLMNTSVVDDVAVDNEILKGETLYRFMGKVKCKGCGTDMRIALIDAYEQEDGDFEVVCQHCKKKDVYNYEERVKTLFLVKG